MSLFPGIRMLVCSLKYFIVANSSTHASKQSNPGKLSSSLVLERLLGRWRHRFHQDPTRILGINQAVGCLISQTWSQISGSKSIIHRFVFCKANSTCQSNYHQKIPENNSKKPGYWQENGPKSLLKWFQNLHQKTPGVTLIVGPGFGLALHLSRRRWDVILLYLTVLHDDSFKTNKFEIRYQPGVLQRILVVILVGHGNLLMSPAHWIPVFRDFYKPYLR